MKEFPFKITVIRADNINGFAAYLSPSILDENGEGLVLLNVEGTIGAAIEHDIPAREILLEFLMHEFGHAMQDWMGLNMDEETVDKIIEGYKEKYNW